MGHEYIASGGIDLLLFQDRPDGIIIGSDLFFREKVPDLGRLYKGKQVKDDLTVCVLQTFSVKLPVKFRRNVYSALFKKAAQDSVSRVPVQ